MYILTTRVNYFPPENASINSIYFIIKLRCCSRKRGAYIYKSIEYKYIEYIYKYIEYIYKCIEYKYKEYKYIEYKYEE